jgi:vacuolar-type H+-ATPase subunit I/STV1
MDDLEAVAKEQKINFPHLQLEDLKKAIASELGLDPETKPEEWDSVVKTRLAIKGAQAKENIKNLLKGIEVPKTATKEEREQALATARQEVEKAIAPVREKYNKFDKYTNGDFDFDVPTEFKDKVDNIFKGMFLDSGMEVNEKNLASAELFKRAMFVEEYFPKIREVLVAQGYTKHKEEVEKLLNNDQPPNTTTAADQVATPELQGLSKFFQDEKSQRTSKI